MWQASLHLAQQQVGGTHAELCVSMLRRFQQQMLPHLHCRTEKCCGLQISSSIMPRPRPRWARDTMRSQLFPHRRSRPFREAHTRSMLTSAHLYSVLPQAGGWWQEADLHARQAA